jgi:hypothetical protein
MFIELQVLNMLMDFTFYMIQYFLKVTLIKLKCPRLLQHLEYLIGLGIFFFQAEKIIFIFFTLTKGYIQRNRDFDKQFAFSNSLFF